MDIHDYPKLNQNISTKLIYENLERVRTNILTGSNDSQVLSLLSF